MTAIESRGELGTEREGRGLIDMGGEGIELKGGTE